MSNVNMTNAQIEKIHDEIAKLMVETVEINKEATKISKETFWYPMFIAMGLIGSVVTITTIIIKLI